RATEQRNRPGGRHRTAADHRDLLDPRGRVAGCAAAAQCRHQTSGHCVRPRQHQQLAVGSVMAVDSQIDTTTGTVRVRAQFDNADNALFPNQFVNVQLLVKTLQNALTIPTAAIQRGSPSATTGGAMGTYVYLVNADSTVAVRQITVGPTYVDPHGSSMTTVESGLAAGDKVVTDGADRLRDGLHVRVSS